MPLPPFLISVSAFLCERILHEADKVLSAIRIVDVFYVPERPADAPKEAVAMISPYCLVTLKAQPGHQGRHSVQMKMLSTKGEMSDLGEALATEFAVRFEFGKSVPSGANISIQMNIIVKNYGTCYVCVYVDGEEITRTPLTILPPPKSAEKTG